MRAEYFIVLLYQCLRGCCGNLILLIKRICIHASDTGQVLINFDQHPIHGFICVHKKRSLGMSIDSAYCVKFKQRSFKTFLKLASIKTLVGTQGLFTELKIPNFLSSLVNGRVALERFPLKKKMCTRYTIDIQHKSPTLNPTLLFLCRLIKALDSILVYLKFL